MFWFIHPAMTGENIFYRKPEWLQVAGSQSVPVSGENLA
jgi:hypothetical protein